MITIRKSDERGYANHGWLEARHSFSFANYMDPEHMGFGSLRVINQDRVQPGKGFGTHGHRDMEILTYVLSGSLEHKDSMGTGSVIVPGDVQYMSAGKGVTHSEFNASQEELVELFQLWIEPAELGAPPRYGQRHFPAEERSSQLRVVASPDGREDSLQIRQDATMYASLLPAGGKLTHTMQPGRRVWIQLAGGRLQVGGELLEAGDGAAVEEQTQIDIESHADSEFLLLDLA